MKISQKGHIIALSFTREDCPCYKLPHPDGRPTHTFRSYTAFFSGGNVTVEDLTIASDAAALLARARKLCRP